MMAVMVYKTVNIVIASINQVLKFMTCYLMRPVKKEEIKHQEKNNEGAGEIARWLESLCFKYEGQSSSNEPMLKVPVR